jgi:hypothetical protein
VIYDKEAHRFILSTGRTFEPGANHAIGVDNGRISVGYDSSIALDPSDETHDWNSEPTPQEAIEIADYVIAQWVAFKATLG